MPSYTHSAPRAVPLAVGHLVCLALICIVAFLVPYLGVSVLNLPHDVFYVVYFAITIALIASYIRVERVDVAEVFRSRWRWTLRIGIVLAAQAKRITR